MTAQTPGRDESVAPQPDQQPTQSAAPTSDQAPSAAAAPVPGEHPYFGPYGIYHYGPPQPYPYGPSHSAAPAHGLRAHPGAWKSATAATAVVAVAGLSFMAGTTQARTHVVRVPVSRSYSQSFGQFPFGNSSSPGSTSDRTASRAKASAAQQVGIVDINTNLKYESARGAGTGMVMASNGEILTNNHVVDGATSIKATLVATGKTYTAQVVGTDPTQDIAVLQLEGASNLPTANFGDSNSVKVGAPVTGVGNAGGVDGTPTAASGTVIALNQAITASDDGANAENLPSVIVSNAPIQPGDSGGPLYNSNNQVVGIDTAANTSGATQGFSIPIDTARAIAAEIAAGGQTPAIHVGYPGFLGISVGKSTTRSGALVAEVLRGTPAASTDIVRGDRITKLDSSRTPTATALHNVMSSLKPGTITHVTYVDHAGRTHTVTVTLMTGPAD